MILTKELKKQRIEDYAASVGKSVKYIKEDLRLGNLNFNESGFIVSVLTIYKQSRKFKENTQLAKRKHTPTTEAWKATHARVGGRWVQSPLCSKRWQKLRPQAKV